MSQMTQIRKRHIRLMKITCETIGHIIKSVDQEQATTLSDGPDGWTTLEVMAHLRDFDGYFRNRAVMMLEQDHPELPAYDHEALAIERNYNDQSLTQVFTEFVQSRGKTVEFFERLTPDQWERAGNHPERESFSMTDAVMQVGLHDANHIEQITRILAG